MAEETTQTVESKLVEMLDAIQNGAAKIGETTVQYAPDVADAMLWVVRIDSLNDIVMNVCGIILCVVAGALLKKLWRWGVDNDEQDEPHVLFTIFMGGGLTAVLGVLSFVHLFDVWTWVGVIEPKLKVAKMLVDSVV